MDGGVVLQGSSKTLSFHQWLVSIGKSEKTAKNYSGAIQSSISNWALDGNIIKESLSEIREPAQFYALIEPIQQLPVFLEKNTKGNGMYSAALRQYAEYLDSQTNQSVQEDIEEILSSDGISNTDKATLVNTRVGQGKFRSQLIDQWRGCAVTGYRDVRFLLASHIKPWRESNNEERLNRYNGVLLLPNLDKVFDLGYITFEESGRIRLSRQLENTQVLGVHSDMSIKLNDCNQYFMAYHREQCFRG
ncbi:HNH endonuclease [uncultured Pseudoteredinibacter sp.]|uniref:HNH endonuclease n=1 Tax=uncultured Pseudoteredinibacter sp. TaxID=1641701 RepID=UPI00260B829D|nr:HNH endonuclease [uncultured Pseudoteredinibacter sp.]